MSHDIVPTPAGPSPQQALATRAETSVASAAAQSVAAVQARYQLAVARPRNPDAVRVRLLAECRRPGFAEVAKYNKPIGQGVTGPSIRFVEAALRSYGNVYVETPTIYDDDAKRIVRVIVTDLESNTCFAKDVTVAKTIERRNPKGAEVLSSRANSTGQTVYTIVASDDDILNKEGALISKALRTLGLRLLPGDLVDEAMATADATVRDATAKDPAAARRQMVDAFVAIGVQPDDLVAFLGHGLDKVTPAEIGELRKIHTSIKDGEARWTDYVVSIPSDVESQGTSAVKAKLEERRNAND